MYGGSRQLIILRYHLILVSLLKPRILGVGETVMVREYRLGEILRMVLSALGLYPPEVRAESLWLGLSVLPLCPSYLA